MRIKTSKRLIRTTGTTGTILFFQPRIGNIDINGKFSRWMHNDKRSISITARHWLEMPAAQKTNKKDSHGIIGSLVTSLG